MSQDSHVKLLQYFGAADQTLDELENYCNHSFESNNAQDAQIADGLHIPAYQRYVQEAEIMGAFKTLKAHLVQLQFPIQEGISQTDIYKDVVLRGKSRSIEKGLSLLAPESIDLQVYQDDLIGKVPVLIIPEKKDFDTIVCALTNKNEPKVIPASMGAAFIKGLNNWSRIHDLKNDWVASNPFGSWNEEFRQHILPYPEQYQDQLILLSKQPYSNVQAEMLGLDDESWLSYSIEIRKAHECAHLFTLRQYGKMENHIFDELIADYVGITSALGRFELKWFLHFMGLEDPYVYREGGRFQNYLADLSPESISILREILKSAAQNLSEFDSSLDTNMRSSNRRNLIMAICETGFLPLASAKGPSLLAENYESLEISYSST